MTTELTNKQIKIEQLKEFANQLKVNGFTVLVSKKHSFEWLYYEKNGDFGTVSPDHFTGFNFGSVHKPCRQCGTGFGTDRETELTIERANESLGIPYWATSLDRKEIKKYKSVEEFINSSNNKWAEYYIL